MGPLTEFVVDTRVGQNLSGAWGSNAHPVELDRALEFIDAFLTDPIEIPELARHAGTRGLVVRYGDGLTTLRADDRLDVLIVSHADLDHSGGVRRLVDTLTVDRIISGETLRGMDGQIERCRTGMQWAWDAVRFTVLHPDSNSVLDGNDASCVLLIETGLHRLLLTGDIEAKVEGSLVRARRLPTVDVALVPHHGSRTSSTAAFVRSLDSEIAIVSAGAGNQWGFPKPDVVARWQDSGARVLTTATSGAIGVRVCAGAGVSSISEFRKRARRLWHDSE